MGRRSQQSFDIRSFVVDLVADLRAGQQTPLAVALKGPFLDVQQQAHLLVVEPVLQRLVLTAHNSATRRASASMRATRRS